MYTFSLHVQTRFEFGWRPRLGWRVLSTLRSRGRWLSLARSAKRHGYLDRLIESFKRNGIEVSVFDGVDANPEASSADEAGALASRERVAFVVGLGGGSAIDTAKMAAAVASEPPVGCWCYTTGHPEQHPVTAALPVIAIPTTAGTGSEASPFAVISDRSLREKYCNERVAAPLFGRP